MSGVAPWQIQTLIFLLTVAFAAGGFATGHALALRTARKQINGLGGRVNRIALAVIKIAPDEKRAEVAQTILIGEARAPKD